MMADDLKEGMARLAQSVVPQPEPYRRLLHRARRQRRRRLAVAGAGAVALVAAVVAGPVLVPAQSTPGGVAGSPPPDTAQFQPAMPVDNPLTRRLLDSPARGNLAGDRALVDAVAAGYLAARERLLVDPALDRTRVLFAHDLPAGRSVVVAFVNDTHALIREAVAESGASVPALLARTATPDGPLPPLDPFVTITRLSPGPDGRLADYQLTVAPSGCLAETSSDGRVGADGTVVRSWQATGTDGFVVRGGTIGERWRFTCDGVTRFNGGMVGRATSAVRPEPTPVPVDGARGDVDPRVAAYAARQLSERLVDNGMAAVPPRVLWGGPVVAAPGGSQPSIVVTACTTGGGCAALVQVGIPDRWTEGWSTAVGRPDFVVARLPGDTPQVLVVGPEPAVRAELLGAGGRVLARGPLDRGAGVLRARAEEVTAVKVYDGAGRLIQSMPTVPGLGSTHFGEASIWSW